MAKTKIPGPLERRHLVEKEMPPAQALAIAEAYLADDRCIEAVDFLKLAAATAQLTALRERAIADGDAFLLRAVAGAQGQPLTRGDWQKLGEAASSRGLERYAVGARRQLERGDE